MSRTRSGTLLHRRESADVRLVGGETLHLAIERLVIGEPLGAVFTDVAKLHLVMGWKKEGVLLEHVFKKGKFEDVTMLAIFKDDFTTRFRKRLQEAGR